MANVRTGSSIYIDSTGAISSTSNFKAKYIILTPTAGSCSLILHDNQSSTVAVVRIDLNAAKSEVIDISNAPIVFPNGINVNTITNCVATIIGGV